jgi:hypothetical protein
MRSLDLDARDYYEKQQMPAGRDGNYYDSAGFFDDAKTFMNLVVPKPVKKPTAAKGKNAKGKAAKGKGRGKAAPKVEEPEENEEAEDGEEAEEVEEEAEDGEEAEEVEEEAEEAEEVEEEAAEAPNGKKLRKI